MGDHPALFGWDTLILDGDERPGRRDAAEAENIAALSRCIRQADTCGGINTLSAHMPNFVTGKNFYDTSGRVVSQILPEEQSTRSSTPSSTASRRRSRAHGGRTAG
ncbi:hypothetical protein SGLAM104S_05637 [Streptomyces glaucescens]